MVQVQCHLVSNLELFGEGFSRFPRRFAVAPAIKSEYNDVWDFMLTTTNDSSQTLFRWAGFLLTIEFLAIVSGNVDKLMFSFSRIVRNYDRQLNSHREMTNQVWGHPELWVASPK